eukprot:7318506-Prymnesium_polylepis.1
MSDGGNGGHADLHAGVPHLPGPCVTPGASARQVPVFSTSAPSCSVGAAPPVTPLAPTAPPPVPPPEPAAIVVPPARSPVAAPELRPADMAPAESLEAMDTDITEATTMDVSPAVPAPNSTRTFGTATAGNAPAGGGESAGPRKRKAHLMSVLGQYSAANGCTAADVAREMSEVDEVAAAWATPMSEASAPAPSALLVATGGSGAFLPAALVRGAPDGRVALPSAVPNQAEIDAACEAIRNSPAVHQPPKRQRALLQGGARGIGLAPQSRQKRNTQRAELAERADRLRQAKGGFVNEPASSALAASAPTNALGLAAVAPSGTPSSLPPVPTFAGGLASAAG